MSRMRFNRIDSHFLTNQASFKHPFSHDKPCFVKGQHSNCILCPQLVLWRSTTSNTMSTWIASPLEVTVTVSLTFLFKGLSKVLLLISATYQFAAYCCVSEVTLTPHSLEEKIIYFSYPYRHRQSKIILQRLPQGAIIDRSPMALFPHNHSLEVPAHSPGGSS